MSRPWEKTIDRKIAGNRASAGTKRERPATEDTCTKPSSVSNDNDIADECTSHEHQDEEPPYVTVEGIRYYSDRFYLNVPTGLKGIDISPDGRCSFHGDDVTKDDDGPSASTQDREQKHIKCTCGHFGPPPLLDRASLIRSLVSGKDGGGGTIGAICATYTFDPLWMVHELPDLFPPAVHEADGDFKEKKCKGKRRKIPTLVLHGHKGLRLYTRQGKKSNKDEEEEKVSSIKAESRGEKEAGTRPSSSIRYETQTHRKPDGKDVEVLCIDSDTDGEGRDTTSSPTAAAKDEHRRRAVGLNLPSRRDGIKHYDDHSDFGTDDEDDGRTNGIKEEERDQQEIPPEEGWRKDLPPDDDETDTDNDEDDDERKAGRGTKQQIFADSVHVTEVLATWVPPLKVNGASRKGPASADARRISGAGSAASPVTIADSSDEDEVRGRKKNVIVIDSSSEDEDDSDSKGEVEQDGANSTAPRSDEIDPSLCVAPEIVERREGRVGVHHPKFMILFERRGSVVVIVTTSNLTRMGATEGIWLQRFEPRDHGSPSRNGSGRTGSSDFGHVLSDYLKRQTVASEPNRLTPDGFVRKYLGFSGGLDELCCKYSFEEAQVHLIPTVPGDYGYKSRLASNGGKSLRRQGIDRPILYGPQRVADILARIRRRDQKRRKNGQPPSFIGTDSDRLTIQCTSFGGNWSRQNMEAVVRSYMGIDAGKSSQAASSPIYFKRNESSDDSDDDCDDYRDILDSLDIYWPSQSFFESIAQQKSKRRKLGGEEKDDENSYENTDPMRGFYCFHSTQNFNTNNLAVISRMVQYKTAVSRQIPLILCPHIKTVSRLLGDYYENDSRFEHAFSWFILTSACLSRGAQGRIPEMRGFESDADIMGYSNFELGVMFCSKTGATTGSNRLYGFKPKACRCSADASASGWNGSLVHLPVPYQLRAEAYQADEDDANMCETPYFHELTEGAGAGGHLSLCPLGKEMIAKACKN